MRVTQKMELIDYIARELQRRFTYTEIDMFLAEFHISSPQNIGTNSKWVYSKTALRSASEEIILKIAEELGLDNTITPIISNTPPRNWQETKNFRLFISHISKDKDKAMRLRECLLKHGVSGFVAHEDIHPTLEWQTEIERALRSMDAFLAIHTPGFQNSMWTQQEIGFAVGRGAKIISFKMGEDPTGFISKHQALARRNRTAEAVAQEVVDLLLYDDKTAQKMRDAIKISKNLADDDIPF